MHDYLQFFIQEPFNPYCIEWFYLTRINYSLQGRKLFSVKAGKVYINTYFPDDLLYSIDTDFHVYYLSAFSEIEDRKNIELDFHSGFDNLGENYERVLIWKYLANKNDLHVFIEPPKRGKSHLEIPSLFNPRSDTYIGKRYNVTYKTDNELPGFIVKIKDDKDLVNLNKFIKCYLIGKNHNLERELKREFVLDDVGYLSDLTKSFEFVIRRAPIFGSYNLLVYSRQRIAALLREKLASFASEMDLTFQELANVNDVGNLLKYWH